MFDVVRNITGTVSKGCMYQALYLWSTVGGRGLLQANFQLPPSLHSNNAAKFGVAVDPE